MTEREGPLSFPDRPDDGGAKEPDWDHRRDPDLATGDRQPPPPGPPPGTSRYGWIVGLLVLLAFTYIAVNTLRTVGPGARGVQAGHRLPPFAVPLALGDLDADANVASSRGQGQRGKRAACRVRGSQILNVCQLIERGPLVLAFAATGDRACARQLDVLERVRRRFPHVGFAAVALRTGRSGLRELIRRRGWGFPVGYDRDGAVFAVYRVVQCPTLVFAYARGVAARTTVRALSERQVSAAVRRLQAGPPDRRRAPTSR